MKRRVDRGVLMGRTQASVAYINMKRERSDEIALAAFMEIFHPNFSKKKTASIISDARNRRK